VLPAFVDARYIRVEGKPLFIVLRPDSIPDPKSFTGVWRRLAERAGLPGLYLLGFMRGNTAPEDYGLDGLLPRGWPDAPSKSRLEQFIFKKTGRTIEHFRTAAAFRLGLGSPGPRVVSYERVFRRAYIGELDVGRYPLLYSCWDNTPRVGRRGYVFQGSTPETFARVLAQAIQQVASRSPEDRLVFIKSWNEWAEGNYIEPDAEWGRSYLRAIREVVDQCATIRTPIPA
jgi:hypothetical protein